MTDLPNRDDLRLVYLRVLGHLIQPRKGRREGGLSPPSSNPTLSGVGVRREFPERNPTVGEVGTQPFWGRSIVVPVSYREKRLESYSIHRFDYLNKQPGITRRDFLPYRRIIRPKKESKFEGVVSVLFV